MNPRLTRNQQREICAQLGRFDLQLLYKASIHGFTGAAFHQQCDTRSPTVSVGFNASGYVFGGYTKQPFSQSGQYVHDDLAFLFTFSGEKLLKYPVTGPANAVRMIGNSGPYFGEALVLCEVYQVVGEFIKVNILKRTELMDKLRTYRPLVNSVSKARVLLVGPVGAGKSSFFNSLNSVFRGYVTSQAMAGCSTTSLTTQFRTYTLKDGREGKPLPIILCDTMGLEETGPGVGLDDIISILKGHVPDRYQFNPSAPLHSDVHGYRERPELKDKIHCVVYVLDACKVSIMPSKLEETLEAIRKKINLIGVPQLILLTKVDEACPLVLEDVRNVYKSLYIKQMMQEASSRLGLPLSCVVPVKNYSEELEVNPNCDILLLSAVNQMLRFTDNYFDDISDRVSNIKTKE
uniref:Interferon induced protein 44f3 n=1 Tax=Labrus bergylta TaxID=56723 RepID=A0A3Q3NNQ7_9LABR